MNEATQVVHFQVYAREWMDSLVVVPFFGAAFMILLNLWIGWKQGRPYSDPWIKIAIVLLCVYVGSAAHNTWVWMLLWGYHYMRSLFTGMQEYWWTAAFGQFFVLVGTLCSIRIFTPIDWVRRSDRTVVPLVLRPWFLFLMLAVLFSVSVHVIPVFIRGL